MSKILAIMSSPEINGNTDSVLNAVLEKLPNNTYEKVILKDIDIEYYAHDNKHPKEEEKDFLELVEKINKAEIILIATPVYNLGVPAKLKNLIDKIGYIALDSKNKDMFGNPKGIFKKQMYYLVTGGIPGFLKNLVFFLYPNFVLKMTFMFFGAKNIGGIYIGGLSYTNHITNPKNKARLDKISDKISNKLKKYI